MRQHPYETLTHAQKDSKMMTPMKKRLNKRDVSESLTLEGCASKNIHQRMTVVYDAGYVYVSTVMIGSRTVKSNNSE